MKDILHQKGLHLGFGKTKHMKFWLYLCLGLLFMPNLTVQATSTISVNDVHYSYAQVSGTITDTSGLPLIGVTVVEKGTNNGTISDAKGHYSLNVGSGATLVFSFVGYDTQEAVVAGRSVVNVTMTQSNINLDQVVVVGYGSQMKKDVTGAISSISAQDVADRPIVNAAQALQGQAAGVNVYAPSGKPGSSMAVSIRGNTSLNAVNDPLYVVDGVILRNIDFLNPQDIDSFSILKDASSAAIYGASGANGVVIITTKKGLSGKGRINFNSYTGVSSLAKKVGVLNNAQYKALMTELGYTDNSTTDTDWQAETFGQGQERNMQLSISGGTAGNTYYASLGYQNAQGIVAPANYDRYSLRLNLDNDVRSWLHLSTNLNYVNSGYVDVADNAGVARGGTILSALTSPPTIGILNADGTYTSNPNKGGWENPISAAFGPDQKSAEHRIIGNVTAQLGLTPEISFRSNVGTEVQSNRWDYFLDPYKTDYGRSNKGLGRSSSFQRSVWLWENTLHYSKQMEEHAFKALVGTTMQSSLYQSSYLEARDYPNASVPTLNAAATRVSLSTSKAEWSKRSYLGRVNYGFRDTYLLTANLRYDGSSRFAPENRYGLFPSVSGAWRISQEGFWKQNGTVSDLKLRLGWGKTGNDEGIGDYNYYSLFRPNGTGGFALVNLAKPELTWETTTQSNIGLDAVLWKNRLTFTMDLYNKTTNDLLVSVQAPPSSGFPAQVYNVGTIENKGIELGITSLVVDKAVKWFVNANVTSNKNNVVSLGDYTKSLTYGSIYERGDAIRVEPGKPLGSFYGLVSLGVDPATGNIKYQDTNNDGTINASDRTFIGYAQPDYTFGLTNRVNWKNFELNVFIQGVQGNELFNASRVELESMNDSKNQSTAVLDRWTTAGQVTDIPKAIKGSTTNTQISSRFVEDGSYIRVKTVSLTYNFDRSMLNKFSVGSLSIYATAQNLFTLTNYSGFDPEVSQYQGNGPAMGVDYGTYPQSRSFIVGCNIGL